tara:strand:+ start:1 stop:1215 length:1215 start_codon:yes stop_codon:yes gene_type:complete
MDDYNSTMMKYFAFSNIYVFFIHTIISSTLFYIIVLASKAFSGSETNKWTPENFFVFTAIFMTFVLKILVSMYPSLHILKILSHIDLIKDPEVGPQALFLLTETIAFLITMVTIFKSIIKNESEKYETSHIFALPMIMMIVLYIGLAIKILFGDILFCTLERILNEEYSSADSFKSCEKRIYTPRQRKQICDQLSEEAEEFTNVSKNKNMNKLLGYTNIKENFSVDTPTPREIYKCNADPNKATKFFSQIFTEDFWIDFTEPIYDIVVKLGDKKDGNDKAAGGELMIKLIRLTDDFFYMGAIIFIILKMDKRDPGKAFINVNPTVKNTLFYGSIGGLLYYVSTLIALNVIISDKNNENKDDKINIAGLTSMIWAPYILVISAMGLSIFINNDTAPQSSVVFVKV